MTHTIKALLSEQTTQMLEFVASEQELQNAIMDRNWQDADALIAQMRSRSSELSALDRRRHEAVQDAKQELGLHEDAKFAELLSRLEESDRAELNTLYRGLQVAVLRVTSITRGFDAYVRGSVRTTNQILGEVFPDQRGTLYSRRGHRAPADQRAMVLDRHL